MSAIPVALAALITECEALGVELFIDVDGGLAIEGCEEAITPDLVERLKARKADILFVLHAEDAGETINEFPFAWEWLESRGLPAGAVCPCGSLAWRDVPIHDGQSVRRDCAECGRFIEFPVWYGRTSVGSA